MTVTENYFIADIIFINYRDITIYGGITEISAEFIKPAWSIMFLNSGHLKISNSKKYEKKTLKIII